MLTGRDIIYISSIEWTFLWQVHQEIALRLARAGNRVLYIENMGVRSPGLKDASRVVSRLKHWAGAVTSRGVREVQPNLYVCSPLVLPPFGSSLRRQINRHLLLPAIRDKAKKLGMKDVLVWTYLPTDSAVDLLRLFRRSSSVYYCVGDFPSMSANPAEMTESEKDLAQTSDVVMALCAKLAERLSQWAEDVPVFPSGVDLAAFPLEGEERPVNLEVVPEQWPGPVIGYVGGLHKHVDFDLLAELADARPDWSWILIGPFQSSVDKLQGKANVHLLGPRPHEQLVYYLRTFDVCLVPYVKNVYTETVVPAKLNEYLAVGKPVVATDLPTIREFNDRHKVLIATENRAHKFLQAIEEALRLPNDAETIRHRREVAALCDWSIQMEAMSELITSRVRRS
jgi:glycosyltransferase involved in cell wall biosynthesis